MRELARATPLSIAAILLIGIVSCDDPTRLLEVPDGAQRMTLFSVFAPDSAQQPLWIQATDVGRGESIAGLTTEVWAGDRLLFSIHGHGSLDPCSHRYGALGWNSATACPVLPFRPSPGETYTVVVTADDRPTASASVRIPGEFDVTETTAEGSPPGSEGLSATWTTSRGAHRYMIALRSGRTECESVEGCPGGWSESSADTTINTVVQESVLETGSGGWFLDVYALDQGLYDYLTSGVGGEFFSVLPASNVNGGYGVIGSWIRRSDQLTF